MTELKVGDRIFHPFNPLMTGYILSIRKHGTYIEVQVKCDDGYIDLWPLEWFIDDQEYKG